MTLQLNALIFAGLDLMEENVLENLFYRFNHYFPEKRLPSFEINPDLDSIHLKLGRFSVYLTYIFPILPCFLLFERKFDHFVSCAYKIIIPLISTGFSP